MATVEGNLAVKLQMLTPSNSAAPLVLEKPLHTHTGGLM